VYRRVYFIIIVYIYTYTYIYIYARSAGPFNISQIRVTFSRNRFPGRPLRYNIYMYTLYVARRGPENSIVVKYFSLLEGCPPQSYITCICVLSCTGDSLLPFIVYCRVVPLLYIYIYIYALSTIYMYIVYTYIIYCAVCVRSPRPRSDTAQTFTTPLRNPDDERLLGCNVIYLFYFVFIALYRLRHVLITV